jgi:hypothetical protein
MVDSWWIMNKFMVSKSRLHGQNELLGANMIIKGLHLVFFVIVVKNIYIFPNTSHLFC